MNLKHERSSNFRHYEFIIIRDIHIFDDFVDSIKRIFVPICVTNDHGYVPLVVNTSRSFSRSWLMTGFVTRLTRRWVSLVEQELPTLPEHMSSPPVFSGVRVTRSLVLYTCFVDRPFVFFLLVIVLSILLRCMASENPFGMFKLFCIYSVQQGTHKITYSRKYNLSPNHKNCHPRI